MADAPTVDPRAIPSAVGDRGGPGAWVQYLAVRGVLGCASRLPDGVEERAVAGLARAARALDRRHSDSARNYLRAALGCARVEGDLEERVLQAWRHFFRITLDSVAFERRVPQASLLDHYEVPEDPAFHEALASRRGGIFLTPHVGDWEAASAALPHLGAEPLFAVARPPRNRPLSRHLLAVRERRRIHVLPRKGAISWARKLLRQGAWVGMLPDQRPGGRGVIAPFFGRPARCERSVGALATRLEVPVVVGAAYLTEERFRYRGAISAVMWPDELRGLTVEEVTTKINAAVEPLILAHPDQYYWIHDRFRGSPPEEPA